VSAEEVEPSLKLLWSAAVSDGWDIAGNFNLGILREDGSYYSQPEVSVSNGFTQTEESALFLEYFGLFPEDHPSENYVDGGVTYAICADVQIDARIGFGLNDSAANLFTGLGLVVRQ